MTRSIDGRAKSVKGGSDIQQQCGREGDRDGGRWIEAGRRAGRNVKAYECASRRVKHAVQYDPVAQISSSTCASCHGCSGSHLVHTPRSSVCWVNTLHFSSRVPCSDRYSSILTRRTIARASPFASYGPPAWSLKTVFICRNQHVGMRCLNTSGASDMSVNAALLHL